MHVVVTATVGRTIRQFLAEQLADLERRGHRVTLLCAGVNELGETADTRAVVAATWKRALLTPATLRALHQTRRLLADDVDIVYTHTAVASAIVRLAVVGRRGRPTVVYCAHGFDGAEAQPLLRRTLSRSIERALARWTDLLFVMNDEDERWARSAKFHRVERVRSIGIDLDHYRSENIESFVSEHGPYVVAVGELSARKRFGLLVEAFAHVQSPVHLYIAGTGAQRGALVDLARQRGVDHRITFLGHVADPRPLIAGAKLMVSTSRQEGLPRGLLESAALGVPVVATSARGVTDLVGEGIGTLTDGEAVAVAAAIDALLGSQLDYRRAQLRCDGVAAKHDVASIAPAMTASLLSVAVDRSASLSVRRSGLGPGKR